MRILYHHRTLGDGAEGIHIREMVKAFRELGHTVRVIGPVGESKPEASSKSHVLGKAKRMIPHALYELLEIAYTGYCFFSTAVAIVAFRPAFVYDRYIIFNAGTALAARVMGVPICLEVNAPLAKERSIEKDERLFFRKVATGMESWICTAATVTIVVSTPLREYLESIGVPKGKCIVMANGVDPIRFAPKAKATAVLERLALRRDVPVVGFTGILRGWHGLELLTQAIGEMTRAGIDVCLLIVGDGPYRATLEKTINEMGLQDAVRITGRIPYEDVAEYVSLFDIAVSPRATFYASPMKVIEYMALGKPVVVPDTPNFLDIIDHDLNGVTFRDGNVQALQRALTRLVMSPDERYKLGKLAREKVEKRLNWQWNAAEVCNLMYTHVKRH